jgi:hypothetical protein
VNGLCSGHKEDQEVSTIAYLLCRSINVGLVCPIDLRARPNALSVACYGSGLVTCGLPVIRPEHSTLHPNNPPRYAVRHNRPEHLEPCIDRHLHVQHHDREDDRKDPERCEAALGRRQSSHGFLRSRVRPRHTRFRHRLIVLDIVTNVSIDCSASSPFSSGLC